MSDQPKEILFVYYKLFKAGGVARVLVSLANELVKQGHGVTILVLINNTESFFELDKRIKIVAVDTFSHWGFKKINVNLNKYFPISAQTVFSVLIFQIHYCQYYNATIYYKLFRIH